MKKQRKTEREKEREREDVIEFRRETTINYEPKVAMFIPRPPENISYTFQPYI